MKILGMIAAGLLGALSLAPAANAAPAAPAAMLAVAGVAGAGQAVVVRERTVVRRDEGYRGYRGDRGNRFRSRRVCTNRYRHGRAIRTCRMVRSRR